MYSLTTDNFIYYSNKPLPIKMVRGLMRNNKTVINSFKKMQILLKFNNDINTTYEKICEFRDNIMNNDLSEIEKDDIIDDIIFNMDFQKINEFMMS